MYIVIYIRTFNVVHLNYFTNLRTMYLPYAQNMCYYFTTQTATNGPKYPQCWSKIPKVLMSIFTNPKHVLKIRPRSTDDCKDSEIVHKSVKIHPFSVQ